jgi:hypothetical protein
LTEEILKGYYLETLLLAAITAASVSLLGMNSKVSPLYASSSSGISSSFASLGTPSDLVKIIDNDDGYVYYRASVYACSYTPLSNLYILNTQVWFTPGYAAYHAYGGTYHEGSRLNKGSIGITLHRFLDSSTNSLGGVIYPKAFWPQSSTVVSTITSSFSTTFSLSWQNSHGSGVKIGLGGDAEISEDSTSSFGSGLSFTWDKSVSSTVPDPIVSGQYAPSGAMQTSWSYETQSVDTTGKITYCLETNVLFEMGIVHQACGVNAFQFTINVSFYG